MRGIPVEVALEVETAMPEFVDVIQRQKPSSIVVALEDFEGQPELLYKFLWYALSKNKSVTVQDPH